MRVDGRPRPGDLPPGNRPAGWWNYAGLLREVYLRRVAPLDVVDLTVRTKRLGAGARVTVSAAVGDSTGSPVAAVTLTHPSRAAALRPTTRDCRDLPTLSTVDA